MRLSNVFLVCLVCTVQLALANIKGLGLCPRNVQTMQDFNIKDYAGRWYEYSRYYEWFSYRRICTYSDFSLLPDGKMSIFTSESNHVNPEKTIYRGKATLVEPGKLIASYEGDWSNSNYWVLGTDYVNYAVVYSCSRHVYNMVWILTREPLPSRKVIEAAENIVRQNDLPLRDLVKTKHDKCIYDYFVQ